MKNESILLKNVTYLNYSKNELSYAANISIEGSILKFNSEKKYSKELDCSKYLMIPPFVQIHTHLCQHLYKGLAEDMSLYNWLKKHILSYEYNLTRESLRLSCKMALYELIESGTTVILDMGTFDNQDVVIEEIEKSGIIGFSGNILLDRKVGKWSNDINSYIDYSRDMIIESKKTSRAKYALCPRFFPGITKKGISKVLKLKEEFDLILHTHASETENENEFAFKNYKMTNIEAMNAFNMLSEKTVIAHCIQLRDRDYDYLKKSHSTVCHCPSSNMKLGSGIADVEKMIKMKINVGLGSDGAPCNNNMNQMLEMRLCGLLQKVKHGSKSMSAKNIFKMATFNGLKPLSMEKTHGIIEDGKKADFLLVKKESIHTSPFEANPFSAIVYSMYPSDIQYVFANGKVLKEKGRVIIYNENDLIEKKRIWLKNLLFHGL
ncbi:MAG: hypothetical protein COX48_00535 [bacterium (Candidatus Stahlbacteria) CG23_combo_of_CG06-09_8_20_14_all_34_7]|nr:MAG: hypothetical protein COX48_00535 [bacterium (Candidatus Stahlbacteria) CG23_combo_of_CG06-09_8_20_14_all_34_7]